MQKQVIPINKSTENNPIKMFVVVLSLAVFFIIHHSFVNNVTTFCNYSTN